MSFSPQNACNVDDLKFKKYRRGLESSDMKFIPNSM